MTTTPHSRNPDQNPAGRVDCQAGVPATTLSLSQLLSRAVVGARGQKLRRLSDVIVQLRGTDYPLVTGLVADLGGRGVFVPADKVTDWDTEQVTLASARVDLREFERRPGEVLLHEDILSHRLIDIPRARLVRAYDRQLVDPGQGWFLSGVDTRQTSWWRRALGRVLAGHDQHDEGEPTDRGYRDWKVFEALIGHQPSMLLRAPTGRLRWLKPAQIADLLEQALHDEQTELFNQVHTDPELEADVFEELNDHRQSRLLRDRTDSDIATVLAHMRADDAPDAIADSPRHWEIVSQQTPGVELTTISGGRWPGEASAESRPCQELS